MNFHLTVFWSCTWGANYARLVWEYFLQLKWPQKKSSKDPGITWVELAISFILWSGWPLPVEKYLRLNTWLPIRLVMKKSRCNL